MKISNLFKKKKKYYYDQYAIRYNNKVDCIVTRRPKIDYYCDEDCYDKAINELKITITWQASSHTNNDELHPEIGYISGEGKTKHGDMVSYGPWVGNPRSNNDSNIYCASCKKFIWKRYREGYLLCDRPIRYR